MYLFIYSLVFNTRFQHSFGYLQAGKLPHHCSWEIPALDIHSLREIANFPAYKAIVDSGAHTYDPHFVGDFLLCQVKQPPNGWIYGNSYSNHS